MLYSTEVLYFIPLAIKWYKSCSLWPDRLLTQGHTLLRRATRLSAWLHSHSHSAASGIHLEFVCSRRRGLPRPLVLDAIGGLDMSNNSANFYQKPCHPDLWVGKKTFWTIHYLWHLIRKFNYYVSFDHPRPPKTQLLHKYRYHYEEQWYKV